MIVRPVADVRRDVVAQWSAICKSARTRPEARSALPKVPKLLGSSVKVEKGEAQGIETAVLYMAPATEAFRRGDGRTLCPFATKGCASACLGAHAGRMIFAPVKLARLWKATLYLGARNLWRELLTAEALAFVAAAERRGFLPAIRVDGSTDTGEGARLAERLGAARCSSFARVYDYTKVPARALRYAAGRFSPFYHVTFSYSGENEADARRVLSAGGNVAAVLSTAPGEAFPETVWGFPVVDGDAHDARFLDPHGGHVIALRFKQTRGRKAALARAIRSGFVVDVA